MRDNERQITAEPGTKEWRELVREDAIDPERPIIDPHHHLWQHNNSEYLLEDLWLDTSSGHNVQKTVYVECRTKYRQNGPVEMMPVGETEYVASVAQIAAQTAGRSNIAGIVAHADLRLGENVEPVLQAHEQAGEGLFRGIRHAGPFDKSGSLGTVFQSVPCPYSMAAFRDGIKMLGRMGLTYDTWHFHHQNQTFLELARAAPNTIMVLDHFGCPIGVGRYADKREETFASWSRDMIELSSCENVVAKLGGLAMPFNGFGWHTRTTPPSSDEFVDAQSKYYLHMIDCFGPDRCMFESNFPVDRMSISYSVLWNGLKKIVSGFSEDEKHALFFGTAERTYRL